MFKTPDQIKQHTPSSKEGGLGNQEGNENKIFIDTFNEYNRLKTERQNIEVIGYSKENNEKLKELILKEDNILDKLLESFYKTPTIGLAGYHLKDDGTLSLENEDDIYESDVEDIKVIPEGIFRRTGVQLGDLNVSKIDSIEAKNILEYSVKNKKFLLEALDLKIKKIEESKEKLNKELKAIEELQGKL